MPSSRQAFYAALALFGVLAAVQLASSLSALAAWRYPYEVRGAHTLSTALQSGPATAILSFRMIVAARSEIGVDRLGLLRIPDSWDPRVPEFAGNILASKVATVSYTWQLPNAEFDHLLASGKARLVETGIYVAQSAPDRDYALFTDANQDRMLVAPYTTWLTPPASAGGAGTP